MPEQFAQPVGPAVAVVAEQFVHLQVGRLLSPVAATLFEAVAGSQAVVGYLVVAGWLAAGQLVAE